MTLRLQAQVADQVQHVSNARHPDHLLKLTKMLEAQVQYVASMRASESFAQAQFVANARTCSLRYWIEKI